MGLKLRLAAGTQIPPEDTQHCLHKLLNRLLWYLQSHKSCQSNEVLKSLLTVTLAFHCVKTETFLGHIQKVASPIIQCVINYFIALLNDLLIFFKPYLHLESVLSGTTLWKKQCGKSLLLETALQESDCSTEALNLENEEFCRNINTPDDIINF